MYSDNGEFKCTAFLYKVAQIAEELNMTVIWNFTCPGHGKGKHDGEGHVVKVECRSAVMSSNISYNKSVEPYSETIVRHMEQHFNNNNHQYAFDRKFYSAPESEYVHYKAKEVCRTFGGISKYYCFVLIDSNTMHYRPVSCHCNNCVLFGWEECLALDICDKFRPYHFKPIINQNTDESVVIDAPINSNWSSAID